MILLRWRLCKVKIPRCMISPELCKCLTIHIAPIYAILLFIPVRSPFMRSPPTTTAMLFLVDIIRSLLIQLIYWVLNQVGK